MAGDLPRGKWSAVLVGPWWPAAPTGLREGSQHWQEHSGAQENFVGILNSTRDQLSRNEGVTADDLVSQYDDGSKFHMDLAEKYRDKGDEFGSAAEQVDGLRASLTAICDHYNKAIDDIVNQAHKDALSVALAEQQIIQLISEANEQAAAKAAAAAAAMTTCLQNILAREGLTTSAQDFMASQGIHSETPKPPNAAEAAKSGLGDLGNQSKNGTAPTEAHSGHGPKFSDVGLSSNNQTGPEAPQPGAPATNGSPTPTPGTSTSPVSNVGGGGAHVPGVGGVHVPGGGGVPAGGLPGGGVPGGGLSPAAGLGQGLSPQSLASSFQSGAQAGAPISPGAQSLASGAVHAAAPPPQPVAPPTMAANGGGFESAPVEHSAAPAAPASYGGGGYQAPTPIVAAPMGTSAPLAGAPAIPPSSLPAYGADIRPSVVAPPVAPTLPTGPVGGAPVASPAVSPAAGGGPVVSPVERTVPAAGAAAQSGSAAGVASAGVATAGAVAGDAAQRAAEEQRLKALVEAVARQEPALEWAAGLRDDGTTTLLTTNLAGGWIPPYVRLPAGVTLLAPAARRLDMSAADLLGAIDPVVTVAPHGYISDPGPSDPPLTGERARYGQHVEEFGPDLLDAVNRRSGLASTQAAARAAVRGTGVLDHEIAEMRQELEVLRREVVQAYPHHQRKWLADWMLLASIAALVDNHEALAHYHLAWYKASFATTGSGRH